MKSLAITLLFLLPIIGLSQNYLIGDTILPSFNGDTIDHRIDKPIPQFKGYTFIESGYEPDSITNEILILKNQKHYLIVVTEFYRHQEKFGNIIIRTIKFPLKQNQRIIYNFCGYNGKDNPNIIAVMEDTNSNKIFDKVVKAWEIKKLKRKVIKANKSLVHCEVDESGN